MSRTNRIAVHGPWRWAESILLLVPMRLFLGGLFLLAGSMKLFHVTPEVADPAWSFAESIKAYKLVPMPAGEPVVTVLAYVIPWTELFAGAMLVLGVWTKGAALLVLTQLVVFGAANVSVIWREISASCSCFGELGWPCGREVGWCQVIRNAVLAIPALYLVVRGGGLIGLDRTDGACACVGGPRHGVDRDPDLD